MTRVLQGDLSVRDGRFAIVQSRYNSFITDRLLEGALDALRGKGVEEEDIVVLKVPGSFEIPQAARKAAASGEYCAVVCLGAIIRGQTSHFQLISQECARGVQQVAADCGLPVTFGVITAENMDQAVERAGERSQNKGWEAALAAMEMANLFSEMERHQKERSATKAES
jgi:6,7-dimethyl-8-ribityllumazine synthase